MANYVGGYAIIDCGGQTLSKTAITVPGSFNACLSGKPIVLENVSFEADVPAVSVFVSMCAWNSSAKESMTLIFDDTYITVANDDTVVIET